MSNTNHSLFALTNDTKETSKSTNELNAIPLSLIIFCISFYRDEIEVVNDADFAEAMAVFNAIGRTLSLTVWTNFCAKTTPPAELEAKTEEDESIPAEAAPAEVETKTEEDESKPAEETETKTEGEDSKKRTEVDPGEPEAKTEEEESKPAEAAPADAEAKTEGKSPRLTISLTPSYEERRASAAALWGVLSPRVWMN